MLKIKWTDRITNGEVFQTAKEEGKCKVHPRTEPRCLHKGALYLYLYLFITKE